MRWIIQHISKKTSMLLIMVISAVILFCVVFLMLDANKSLTPYEQSGQLLSELSESKCLEFVISKGVQIPSSFHSDYIAGFVKEMICAAEQAPHTKSGASFTDTVFLFESIRKVVNKYYGVDGGTYLIDDTAPADGWSSHGDGSFRTKSVK